MNSTVNGIGAWLSAMVMAIGLVWGATPKPAERTLTLTGDLLLLPAAGRADTKKGAETADSGLLEVSVDGMLIHRVGGIFPRKVDDVRFWAFLDGDFGLDGE